MNDPIALLKQDHREVAVMLSALSESKPGTRRRAAVEKLAVALRIHLQYEEDEIYPLIEQKIGVNEAREATIEHRLAREGLEKLQELVDQPGFGAIVAMLTAGIKHHVKEEETEIFPDLKRKLDRSQLSALGDALIAYRSGARANGRRPARSEAH